MQAGVQVAAATIREAEAQTGAALAEFEAATESEGRVRARSARSIDAAGPAVCGDPSELGKSQGQSDQASRRWKLRNAMSEARRRIWRMRSLILSDARSTRRVMDSSPTGKSAKGAWPCLCHSRLGTFVDTSRVGLVASFGQNVLQPVNPGDRAEFAFESSSPRSSLAPFNS